VDVEERIDAAAADILYLLLVSRFLLLSAMEALSTSRRGLGCGRCSEFEALEGNWVVVVRDARLRLVLGGTSAVP
jgi:hypothetical protein